MARKKKLILITQNEIMACWFSTGFMRAENLKAHNSKSFLPVPREQKNPRLIKSPLVHPNTHQQQLVARQAKNHGVFFIMGTGKHGQALIPTNLGKLCEPLCCGWHDTGGYSRVRPLSNHSLHLSSILLDIPKEADSPAADDSCTAHHWSNCVVASLLPLSWIVFSLFFEEQPIDEFQKKFIAFAVMGFVMIIMYLMVSATNIRRTNNELWIWSTALLTPHHYMLCATGNCRSIPISSSIGASSPFGRPIGRRDSSHFHDNREYQGCLPFHLMHHLRRLNFCGALLYRLQPTHPWTPRVILAGMIMFGLSRPLQLVWIVTTLAVSWSDLNVGYALFQLVLTTLFTFLQLYSLSIHRILYKNVVAEQARQKISLFVDESTSTKKTLPISAHGDLDEATLNNKADYERTATFDDDADESSMQV